MTDTRPLASLSAALLARKGEARPAIPRASVSIVKVPEPSRLLAQGGMLGAAMRPAPVQQQERIEHAFAAKPGKVAFTLRLDRDRHMRLRLAKAVSGRSAQQIVTEALDRFLDAQAGLEDLFAHARAAPSRER